MKHFLPILLLSLIACSDPNYHPENYQAFDSMDELVHEIVASIKTQNEAKMLELLDNEKLLLDLLNSVESEDADKTKAYMMTENGRRNFSTEQMNKKQRINALFSVILQNQIKISPNFKLVGFSLDSDTPYSQGSNAQLQNYTLVLDNADGKPYKYPIQVVFWNNKYHLLEVNGFLDN